MKKLFTLAFSFIFFIAAHAQNYNVTLGANLPYPGQSLANIWGFVDTLGNEYALVGASNGMSIVNVTNPNAPFQVIQISGPQSGWREIKTWGRYAYVASEGGGGLQIVDLRNLPGTNLPATNWYPVISGDTLQTIHALHVDAGRAYLYGSNVGSGGIVIANLTTPMSPVYLGRYNAAYVHDGYVRNNRCYAGRIYAGECTVIDVSAPATPTVLQSWQTPGLFTHNSWLGTANDNYCFTTDEVSNSVLASYDITNLANVNLVDQIQSQNAGSGSIVHNTHIVNRNGRDYAVTSWYRDGIVITDVTNPANMVNTGWYDTYAQGSGDGFDGCWGVYPFLPSGTIVASDMDNGLFVLSPSYIAACYIRGLVTDSVTGNPVANATVNIVAQNISQVADLVGFYQTGIGVPGTYSVQYSRPGYITKTINNISFTAGNTVTQDVELVPLVPFAYSGRVVDAVSGNGIASANVRFKDISFTYNTLTDANGDFSFPGIYPGSYEIIAGRWRWITSCYANYALNQSSVSLVIPLTSGIYDDFTWNWGWTVTGDASTGMWEREIPVGTTFVNTQANPNADVPDDCSAEAHLTGNGTTSASANDVDDGSTILTSPVFDAAQFTIPYLLYSRWFFNNGGSGNPNDSLTIQLSNGTQTVTLETVLSNTAGNSSWVNSSFRITDYITPTSTMNLIVRTADAVPGHLVEAGFDHFMVLDSLFITGVPDLASGKIESAVYPNPFSDKLFLRFDFHNPLEAGAKILISDMTGKISEEHFVSSPAGIIEVGKNLSSGIYLVQLFNGNSVMKPLKIVKIN
ncbi:MAG TPA: choice-of-anchor B family protein [Bacteroidia bacterium]|nr:choice-of-anchor B family protein [Bacteroidia bacterium]